MTAGVTAARSSEACVTKDWSAASLSAGLSPSDHRIRLRSTPSGLSAGASSMGSPLGITGGSYPTHRTALT